MSTTNSPAPRWLNHEQQRIWRSYLNATTLLSERLDRDLRAAHDLSLPEYEALVRLSEAPGQAMRMAELAASLHHSRSRLTHTVNRMQSEGLVRRSEFPGDRRGVVAELTDAGLERLVAAAPTHVAGVRDHLVDRSDPNDLAALGRIFRAVVDSLEGARDSERC